MHCEAKQTKMWGLDVLVYCRAMERDGLVVPPKPQNPRRISANNIFVVYFKKLIAQIHTTYECCCSVTQSCPNLWTACPTCPWTTAHQASLSFTISQSLLKFTSTESVMPSNHLILCCPFSSFLQSFPASRSFLMSQLIASGGQSTGASASASVLPMNIQGWSVTVTTDISQKSHDLFFFLSSMFFTCLLSNILL